MADDSGAFLAARAPKQGRSRASFERMIETAAELLKERGNDEFTLTEVSQRGKVSIGSIYCRFDSKDALIREVQLRAMARLEEEQRGVIERLRKKGGDLETIVPALINDIAEFLRKRASVLAPFMSIAARDEAVAKVGKESYAKTVAHVSEILLEHRGEITHPDPVRAVEAVFRISYAALARYLGLGTNPTAVGQGDWAELKEDLGAMSLAFLQSGPAKKRR